MKTEKKSHSLQNYLAIFCFWGMTMLVPLYYNYAYFDMIEAKAGAIRLIVYVVLVIGLILGGVTLLRGQRKYAWQRDFCILDYAMCAFAIIICISWIMADEKGAAFWGNQGWSVGAFMLIGCACCYFLMSRCLPENQNLWLPVLIVNILIFGMAVLHSMKIDIFSLHENIREDQWYQYLSTIGQTNAQMGYLAMVFPVFAVFFLVSRQQISAVLYGIVLLLGEMAIILCGSDGIYVAIGGCLFFLLPFVWKEKKRMIRFLEMVAAFGICIIVICKWPVFGERLDYMEGMARVLVHVPIGQILCVGAVLLAVAMQLLMEKYEKIWKGLLYILEIIMGIGVVGVFIYTMREIQIDSDWGSGRKYLWDYSWNLFCNFSLKNKLFGVGSEMLGSYYEECYGYYGETVLTAHSEFLQYLLTIGVFGAIAWLVICIAVLYTYFKYRSEEKMTIAFLLAMVAYFIQGIIISPQPITAALCCVMLACYRRSLDIGDKNLKIKK